MKVSVIVFILVFGVSAAFAAPPANIDKNVEIKFLNLFVAIQDNDYEGFVSVINRMMIWWYIDDGWDEGVGVGLFNRKPGRFCPPGSYGVLDLVRDCNQNFYADELPTMAFVCVKEEVLVIRYGCPGARSPLVCPVVFYKDNDDVWWISVKDAVHDKNGNLVLDTSPTCLP